MGTARGLPFLPRATRDARRAGLPERREPELVVVGAPLREMQAAAMFLVGLPAGFSLPIVLVVSGDAEDHRELKVTLQAHCALPVRQIEDKDPIIAGRVNLAPADYHLLCERQHFVLSTESPVNGARPSIDVLLESVADAFGGGAVCVLLGTEGQGPLDGRAGAARVRARGGLVIVQNPATSAAGERGEGQAPPAPAGTMLHLSEIAPFVSRLSDLEVT
jgi:two-component system chemotaxis response regulator CheB